MSDSASSSLATKSSAGGGNSICPATRFVVRPDRSAVRVSQGEVDSSFHGSGTGTHQTDDTSANRGTDCGAKSTPAGLGRVLQTRPHPQALPTSRRLDPSTHLVASVPALA